MALTETLAFFCTFKKITTALSFSLNDHFLVIMMQYTERLPAVKYWPNNASEGAVTHCFYTDRWLVSHQQNTSGTRFHQISTLAEKL